VTKGPSSVLTSPPPPTPAAADSAYASLRLTPSEVTVIVLAATIAVETANVESAASVRASGPAAAIAGVPVVLPAACDFVEAIDAASTSTLPDAVTVPASSAAIVALAANANATAGAAATSGPAADAVASADVV
jgi:hypothetical protein